MENTALCNDNIIGPRFIQNSFFFYDLNTFKIFRNASLRSSAAFRYKYIGEGN